MAAAFTLLYIIGGENFLALLTSDKRVIAAAGEYFWWAVLIPLSGMTAFVFDGILWVSLSRSRCLLLPPSPQPLSLCSFRLAWMAGQPCVVVGVHHLPLVEGNCVAFHLS